MAPDPAAGDRPPAAAWPRLTLAILLVLSALSQVDRGIISILVDPITRGLKIDYFQFSLLQGPAFALFYTLFGIPCGMIADRWSRRWLIVGGVLIWSLATVGCGLAATFNHLIVARFFVGAGEAALYPAALSLISDMFPRHKLSGAIAVFSIGSSIGAGVSLFGSGFLLEAMTAAPLVLPAIGRLEPWQSTFFVIGAPGVLLSLLILIVPEPRRSGPHAASATWGAVHRFVAHRRAFFFCHAAGFTLLALLANASGGWMPQLLMGHFGLSPRAAGMTFGCIAAGANISGMLAAGRILDVLIRRGVTDAPLRLFLFTTPVTALLTIVGNLSGNVGVFIACIAIAQIGFSLTGPAAAAIQLVAPAEMRGRISAGFLLVFNLLGLSLGPSVVAWIATHVLMDQARINVAVVITFAIVAPLAWLVLRAGLVPMRRAMAQAETAAAPAGV